MYMSLPILSVIIGLVVLLYDRTLGFRPWRLASAPPQQRGEMRAALVTRGRSLGQILVTVFSVVLLFLYPTLTRRSAEMNHCDTYDLDPTEPSGAGKVQVPQADRVWVRAGLSFRNAISPFFTKDGLRFSAAGFG